MWTPSGCESIKSICSDKTDYILLYWMELLQMIWSARLIEWKIRLHPSTIVSLYWSDLCEFSNWNQGFHSLLSVRGDHEPPPLYVLIQQHRAREFINNRISRDDNVGCIDDSRAQRYLSSMQTKHVETKKQYQFCHRQCLRASISLLCSNNI